MTEQFRTRRREPAAADGWRLEVARAYSIADRRCFQAAPDEWRLVLAMAGTSRQAPDRLMKIWDFLRLS
jgi:hypothetical protein